MVRGGVTPQARQHDFLHDQREFAVVQAGRHRQVDRALKAHPPVKGQSPT